MSSTARDLIGAPRPARPRAWLVAVLSFLAAMVATLAVLVVGAPDPCIDRGPSGAEGMGWVVVPLAVLGALLLTVLVVVLVVLIRLGHRTLAMCIVAAVLGLLAGVTVAGEVIGWRSAQATPAHCRAVLGLPPPPIRGFGDIDLVVYTAPFRGAATVRSECELTPDGERTLWMQVPDHVLADPEDLMEPRIGSWRLAVLQLVPPDDDSTVLELEAHRFELVLGFGQPGRSVVYSAPGNSGWTLEAGVAGSRVLTFNELPQIPELGGGSSTGAPATVTGTVSWRCTPGDPAD